MTKQEIQKLVDDYKNDISSEGKYKISNWSMGNGFMKLLDIEKDYKMVYSVVADAKTNEVLFYKKYNEKDKVF